MIGFCGQTRSPVLVARLMAHGVGECTVRGELLSRKRGPWFYDNGAYRDWVKGCAFNGVRFCRDMSRIHYSRGEDGAPLFVVAPDIVAAGEASLAFTSFWRDDIGELPTYLAVQDGMTSARVTEWLLEELDLGHEYSGIFVGGSLPWKLATGAEWVRFAHAGDRGCHVGRVGVPARVRWARSIGADTIDSCLPLMHEHHMVAFLAELAVAS